MATFKHISSKNADYGAAEQYLTFEHDEFTMKPTLDKNGRLVIRDDYRISSLNCGDEDFAIACMRSNLKYGKNQKREDVKSHHYIISFDPRDVPDNGLTVDRAQALGEQFCKEHFPGHQALVCTHPDGHNHSGNIHVHIVINSLRIEEVPLLPYMERPADTREGCKHRCTDAAMEYFKAEVMEMCHRENLYQIDLLNGSKNRITEREYWAKRKGQAALDKENASQAATGEPPKQTKFETDKEKLRRTIRTALSSAVSFEDFSGKLLQQGVTVKESRGRLSYLTPDRTKPITVRKLGDDFDRAAVLEALTINAQNAARAAETPLPQQEYPRSIKDRLQRNKAVVNAPKQDSVQRMVDIAAKKAEGKGKGYEKWATLHNLKQMAATMSIYEESGFSSPEELEAALAAASAGLHEVTGKLKAVESTLREKKDLQKQLL
uniref:MobA/VirD2-like nuclease domain-containing protein n=1 Tax=Eubacterium plexicaudatum ASF492 TaxID=1235802 RepID=N2A2J2_9FIRM